MKRRSFAQLGLAGLVALSGAPALAQAGYPNKPVRIVAPLAPGGAVDLLARVLGDKLSPLFGQPVIVENKTGASGHLGSQFVAKSPGDGYTLMVGTIGIHAAYASYRKLTYDPSKELQPIAILGQSSNLVVVAADSPYKTFADFLADAKARPGQVSYASAGPGSSIHMITALFELSSGTRLLHVPYKGSGPAMVDLLAGQVNVMFENMSSGMPHVQAGKVRVLAVTGEQRDPRFPKVPTVAESGVPGFSGTSWFTFAAPASVPEPLIQRLNQDVQRVLAAPDVQERFDKLGLTYTPNTPAQAAAFIRSETQKWNRVIDAAQLQLD